MKSKNEILSKLFSILAELESGTAEEPELRNYLIAQLAVLYEILGDDVPEEYWERIEEWLY